MKLHVDKKGNLNPTFNELVDWATWYVIQSIVRGHDLRSTIHTVIMTCRSIKNFREEK